MQLARYSEKCKTLCRTSHLTYRVEFQKDFFTFERLLQKLREPRLRAKESFEIHGKWLVCIMKGESGENAIRFAAP
jgi:hypothetical protein